MKDSNLKIGAAMTKNVLYKKLYNEMKPALDRISCYLMPVCVVVIFTAHIILFLIFHKVPPFPSYLLPAPSHLNRKQAVLLQNR